MSTEGAAVISDALRAPRARIDEALRAFLDEERSRVQAIEPRAIAVLDETERLIRAGGKRLRPAFCFWGYRAAGGLDDDRIVRASAALELLHTMALIHDDLMDDTSQRRGVPSTAVRFTAEAIERGTPADAGRFGSSAAVVAGDLAAVLADRLLSRSGFDAESLARAAEPYHAMRVDMALGQYLDVADLAHEPDDARRVAWLKGGAYTVEGPLMIGAAFADGGDTQRAALHAFGRPLGEAFQLRDDLIDGEAASGTDAGLVEDLVRQARAALIGAPLDGGAIAALDELASLVRPS